MDDRKVELRHRIADGMQVLSLYGWLVDCYVLDFYQDNHWQLLPPAWRSTMEMVSVPELAELLHYECRNVEQRVWPLSVLAVRAVSRRLVIDRNCEASVNEGTGIAGVHPLKQLLSKSVKLKKRHEIDRFAQECRRDVPEMDTALVDIGSGQGNLARTLAYEFGFTVCCIEQNSTLVAAARQKDGELWRMMEKKRLTTDNLERRHPVHLHRKINLDHIDPAAFVRMIEESIGGQRNPTDCLQFGLIGLHPCGDLAPALLRLFLSCPGCRFIKLVCCCYMKLSTTHQHAHHYGFPLSAYCRKTHVALSYEAREIACHAIEQYATKLLDDYRELKVHSYRAALEQLIIRFRPDLRRAGVKSLKVADLSFPEYCRRAIEGMEIHIPPEAMEAEDTRANLARWEDVVKFYTLRLMLAPLVESIILYDRWLYLLEEGVTSATINAIFDPVCSPRNHALTAIK